MPGVEERFLGSWRLVSLIVSGPDGITEPHGPNPLGTLMYTAERFAAVLAARDLPRTSQHEGSPEDAFMLLHGSVAYFGEWEVDEPRGVVIHKAEWASWSHLLDAAQVRYYSFEDDRLILRTAVESDSGLHGEIVFRRI